MSRNAVVNQQMRDTRREEILAHALRLFAARGLAATKIADIAAEAGMAQGLLYHYFRSKDEIFTELIRNAFEKMNTAARALEASPMAPGEKIRTALVQLLHDIETSDAFARTVMLIAQAGISDATPAAAQEILRRESGIPYEVVARIMRAGQQEGSIKAGDPDELAMAFWTMIKGLALHRVVYGDGFKAPEVGIVAGMFFTSEFSE